MSKVELFAAIRRDLRDGISRRMIQAKYQVSWLTVDEAAGSAWPTERKRYPRRPSKVDEYAAIIDAILLADLDAPCKKRHTVRRIHAQLMDEHGMTDVSYGRVRAYVAKRKAQMAVEAGRAPTAVFIPQVHRPGEEAEVDFGEISVKLRGELVICYLFFAAPVLLGEGGASGGGSFDPVTASTLAERMEWRLATRWGEPGCVAGDAGGTGHLAATL